MLVLGECGPWDFPRVMPWALVGVGMVCCGIIGYSSLYLQGGIENWHSARIYPVPLTLITTETAVNLISEPQHGPQTPTRPPGLSQQSRPGPSTP